MKRPEHKRPNRRARTFHDESVRAAHDESREARPLDSTRRASHEAERGGAQSKIYGVAPVLEALRAHMRPLEQITIAEGAHPARLKELLDEARTQRVPVRRAPRAELQRLTGAGANHQGVVAVIAAARYTDADELLDALSSRADGTSRRSRSSSMVSKTRATLEQSCARWNAWARTEFLYRSVAPWA